MVRNLKNIAWRDNKRRMLPEFVIMYCLSVVFLISPVSAIAHTMGIGYGSVWWIATFGAIPLGFLGMLTTLWFERSSRNWWWTWIAGMTMELPCCPIVTPHVNGLAYIPREDNVRNWLGTLPEWSYSIGFERVTFLFRKDAMFYKLAYT